MILQRSAVADVFMTSGWPSTVDHSSSQLGSAQASWLLVQFAHPTLLQPSKADSALGLMNSGPCLRPYLAEQVVTDVEGSTQLWEWDPVVMAAAVDQHNIVLRSLLDQHGGHEVRTDGDSFTLAFHDAADAVAYCIQVRAQ